MCSSFRPKNRHNTQNNKTRRKSDFVLRGEGGITSSYPKGRVPRQKVLALSTQAFLFIALANKFTALLNQKCPLAGALCCLAVRAGFEPAVQFNPYGSLANY
jgi:hypothetical protein